MMRILIATAGRHGGTRGIGEQLGTALRSGLDLRGIPADVTTLDAATVDGISGYDAVVIGSAVYMGRWCKSARRLVERADPDLGLIPIWLFSSGPVDGRPSTDASPQKATTQWDNVPWAQGHRVFGGRLVRSDLSRVERLIVRMLGAKDGDQRSAIEITEWAEQICTAVAVRAASADSL